VSTLRSLLGIGAPAEARFFQFVGVFGIVVTAIYWYVSYEPAGSVLLLAFGLASGLVGVVLAAARRQAPQPRAGTPSGGRPDESRPYLDESGRIPSPTLAPFAVGVGVSIAATSVVFGPAPLLAGIVPFVWGALAWLHRARSEFDATDLDGLTRRR
jgi:hypothetical protein